MNVKVDMELCQLHGHCIFAAENVFAFDDAGDLVYTSEPAEADWDDVEEAAELCPVQAILIAR